MGGLISKGSTLEDLLFNPNNINFIRDNKSNVQLLSKLQLKDEYNNNLNNTIKKTFNLDLVDDNKLSDDPYERSKQVSRSKVYNLLLSELPTTKLLPRPSLLNIIDEERNIDLGIINPEIEKQWALINNSNINIGANSTGFTLGGVNYNLTNYNDITKLLEILAKEGFLKNTKTADGVDGKWGRNTADALTKYMSKYNITGNVNYNAWRSARLPTIPKAYYKNDDGTYELRPVNDAQYANKYRGTNHINNKTYIQYFDTKEQADEFSSKSNASSNDFFNINTNFIPDDFVVANLFFDLTPPAKSPMYKKIYSSSPTTNNLNNSEYNNYNPPSWVLPNDR